MIAAIPSAHEPTHPGALLREDVPPALRVSVADAARALGVTRQTLHTVLSERASVTPAMALCLGKLCATGQGCGCACSRIATCGARRAGDGGGDCRHSDVSAA